MTCGGLRAATTACALVLLAMPTSCRSFDSPARLFESETVDATGDSNLVADKTIDSSHRKKVPQQKACRHAPASPPLVVSDKMTPLGPAIDTLRFRRSYQHRNSRPHLQRRFGTPSFVYFDCSQPSIFESALHQPTLANRRFTFSRLHNNRQ